MNNLCSKCGHPLDENGKCNQCGEEILAYSKIRQKSKALYNRGLRKAKIRNLSGAVEALNRSVRLDKKNIKARNLLGLVYFELGETVLALRQWVISKNLQEEDNDAYYFINEIQNNQTYLDRLNTAIKKYNQSLRYIEQDSVDLAIIQLKKVISINSRFVQAYGLLALCYVKEEQTEKAKSILKRLLEIDQNNYVGRKYLNDLNAGQVSRNNTEEEKVGNAHLFDGPGLDEKKIKTDNTMFQFMGMFLGVLIGLAVMFFLVMPNKVEKKQQEIETRDREIAKLVQDKETLTQDLMRIQTHLDAVTVESEEKAKTSIQLEEQLVEVAKVVQALEFYVKDQMVEAADHLYRVDSSKLPEDETDIYTNLVEMIYPVVAADAWEAGYKKYRGRDYEAGISFLEVAYKYEKESDYADEVLYFMARCYHKLGETEKALTIYEKMLEVYPEATKKNDAEYFIKKISN